MAKNQTSVQTVQVNINNAKAVTAVNKVVENVVVNGALVPDNKDINPGVNSNQYK